MKVFDIRGIIALGITGAFAAGCYVLVPDKLAPLTNAAMLVIGFYFGNKATMDKME